MKGFASRRHCRVYHRSEEKMSRLITSQSYLDGVTVARKRRTSDYNVLLSPKFYVDGIGYQIVMDGHHALAAAKLDGVAPRFSIASKDDRLVGLIEVDLEMFLLNAITDDLFFDVDNGQYIASEKFFWPVGDDEELPKRVDWPNPRRNHICGTAGHSTARNAKKIE